jgi:hypothetical protein
MKRLSCQEVGSVPVRGRVYPVVAMKRILSVLLLVAAVCAGCATRYSLVLNNGEVLTSHGKPTFDAQQGRYFYKDVSGKTASVPASKVREVAPASMVKKEGTQFNK